jgi:hypothetical protein
MPASQLSSEPVSSRIGYLLHIVRIGRLKEFRDTCMLLPAKGELRTISIIRVSMKE